MRKVFADYVCPLFFYVFGYAFHKKGLGVILFMYAPGRGVLKVGRGVQHAEAEAAAVVVAPERTGHHHHHLELECRGGVSEGP